MKTNAMILDLCRDGAHRPRRSTIVTAGAARRTICRDCGCTLTQIGSMRKWILSGRLA